MRRILLLFAAVTLAACASGQPAGEDRSRLRGRIEGDMKQCTQRTGYDPGAAVGLGPNALGPGEREWRGCVYQAIERHVIPKAFAPNAYRELIAADREMTDRVAAGQMTRAERRASLMARVQEIDRQEQADAGRVLQDAAQRERELMRMRDMRNIVSQPMIR